MFDFRNLALTIPDMTEDGNLDRFTCGLKYEIKMEVAKSTANSFEAVSNISLRIDSAVWYVRKGLGTHYQTSTFQDSINQSDKM